MGCELKRLKAKVQSNAETMQESSCMDLRSRHSEYWCWKHI